MNKTRVVVQIEVENPPTHRSVLRRTKICTSSRTMAPERDGWATGQKLELLRSLQPEYDVAKAKKSYRDFWVSLYSTYLTQFPLIEDLFPGKQLKDLDPTESEEYATKLKKLKSRLQEWYRWRSNARSRNTNNVVSGKDLRRIYHTSRKREKKAYEVFAELYSDVVKPAYESACIEKGATGCKMLPVWHSTASTLWAQASEEQREAVNAKMVRAAVGNEDLENMLESPDEDTPESYQHFQTILPNVLQAILLPACRKAGLMAVVTLVGPVPKLGGRIQTTSLQFGNNEDTPLFSEEWVGHNGVYLEALGAFTKKHVFSEELCLSRSLLKAKEGAKDVEENPEDASEPVRSRSSKEGVGAVQGQGSEHSQALNASAVSEPAPLVTQSSPDGKEAHIAQITNANTENVALPPVTSNSHHSSAIPPPSQFGSGFSTTSLPQAPGFDAHEHRISNLSTQGEGSAGPPLRLRTTSPAPHHGEPLFLDSASAMAQEMKSLLHDDGDDEGVPAWADLDAFQLAGSAFGMESGSRGDQDFDLFGPSAFDNTPSSFGSHIPSTMNGTSFEFGIFPSPLAHLAENTAQAPTGSVSALPGFRPHRNLTISRHRYSTPPAPLNKFLDIVPAAASLVPRNSPSFENGLQSIQPQSEVASLVPATSGFQNTIPPAMSPSGAENAATSQNLSTQPLLFPFSPKLQVILVARYLLGRHGRSGSVRPTASVRWKDALDDPQVYAAPSTKLKRNLAFKS
ncbi:hypothetical protein NMY22_g17861 [Coprinellus aureogranulatus]|nr:hypothetical protein NMY22_g17861 [Coprinellus aureogranulatus]